ncbi:MAG TPA: magnesium/cobalt transporter CorA [Gemmatimonadota bacterium]|nr:magnesium/cobalt transporter CorA [Gemmatimonadota bacterium]
MFLTDVPWKKWRHRIPLRTPPGTAPGTLVADPESPHPVVTVMAYDGEVLEERTTADLDDLLEFKDRRRVLWVNVDGLGDAATVERIGKIFGLHDLALEDVLNQHQRPKLEDYSSFLFFVARMPQFVEDSLHSEQLSLFLGQNFVVTFQEREGDCFDPVRRRIRESQRARHAEADYLAYALLDAVVDSYFPVMEKLADKLEVLERAILADPAASLVSQIHQARHELLVLRRGIWPMRDALNSLLRDPNTLVSETTNTYLRDCHDHSVRIIDLVESYRELCSGLIELYQSTVGHRMNEIMKVLTIIATIFIPLTFIAGVYGMNFDRSASPWNMPELGWYWGYPLTLLLMAGVALLMTVYFVRKRWIGS